MANSIPNTLKVAEGSNPSEMIMHGVLRTNSNNNSNSDGVHKTESESESIRDCPRKRLRTSSATSCHKGSIEVTLEGKQLWDEFCRRGTEMIVNRAGR